MTIHNNGSMILSGGGGGGVKHDFTDISENNHETRMCTDRRIDRIPVWGGVEGGGGGGVV